MMSSTHSRPMRRASALGLALAVLLPGCSLAPRYTRPAAPVLEGWSPSNGTAAATSRQLDESNWQMFVTDQTLRDLVQTALEHNRDLRLAVLNIEAARAQFRVQRAGQLPELSADVTNTRQEMPGAFAQPGMAVGNFAQANIALSAFEIDLFGRMRNLSAAARSEYQATVFDERAVRISLVADVCAAYATYQAARERAMLVEQTLKLRRRAYELAELSRSVGATGALDAHEARALVAEAEVQQEQAWRSRARAWNALVLLTGSEPPALDAHAPMFEAGELFRPLRPGLTSDLVARRPDILAAEHRLVARHADIGAARAAFFPSISITGTYGSASDELSGLFESGTTAWSFIPRLSLPLFNGGRLRASLDLAEVRRDSAVATYEKAIQVAFRDVADALADIDTLSDEARAQEVAFTSNRDAATLTQARYRAGVDSHLRYLEAERQQLTAALALLEVRLQQATAVTSLFRALGGGWVDAPDTAAIEGDVAAHRPSSHS